MKTYFKEVVGYYSDIINSFSVEHLSNEIDKQKSESRLCVIKTDLLIARFSNGASKATLRNDLISIINCISNAWCSDCVRMSTGTGLKKKYHPIYFLQYYIALKRVLAMSILLNIDKSYVNKIRMILERDKINDAFFDLCLSKFYKNSKISDDFNLTKPKNDLLTIIKSTSKDEAQLLIVKYLDKNWLNSYKKDRYFNSHKAKERGDPYFIGYWAFEVAAIVKIKGLDDRSFRDHKYYPDRLV